MSSMLGASFPHLAQMKQLSAAMAEMQSQYRAAGDTASFEAMTALALGLADRLNGPTGGKCIIDQLVGIARFDALTTDDKLAHSELGKRPAG
mgnify:CR=1 FL=1